MPRQDKVFPADYALSDEVALAIRRVARRQADELSALKRDEQQRFEELHRELQMRGIECEARYLAALDEIREYLIDEEIGQRLSAKLRAEKEFMTIMLLCATAA